jgi:AraC family ethanolamine operon transcriptional activator
MDVSQASVKTGLTRGLITSNMDELSSFQADRNRHYTQLQPGKLNANFIEASLGNALIFKEGLSLGSRVEAAPAKHFIPFGSILPSLADSRFCGQEAHGNTFVQASGGHWDVSFKGSIEFIGTVFNRDYFYTSYEILKGNSVPKQYLLSQIAPNSGQKGVQYSHGISNILKRLHLTPQIYQHSNVINLLCCQVFKLTIDALPSLEAHSTLVTQPKRILAVQYVIEYLQVHAKKLPDMQKLCQISGVSERSLQYGFIEYLGLTPIQYLRIIRLNGAQSDLLNTSNNKIKVSDVAMNWGFLELGRFSREYKQLFHELPSKTLRQQ